MKLYPNTVHMGSVSFIMQGDENTVEMKGYQLTALCKRCQRSLVRVCRQFSTSVPTFSPKVCVVGSGPAGFYTAQYILKVGTQVFFSYISAFCFMGPQSRPPTWGR